MGYRGFAKINGREYFGLLSFQFLAFFRRLLIYTFLAIYLGEIIGLNNFEVTLMATIPMITSTVFQSTVWGPLLDKYRIPVVFILLGEIIAGIGHISLFFVHKYYLDKNLIRYSGFAIIFILAIIEAFWSMSNVSWNALIAQQTENEERTRLMGQLSIFGAIGGVIGAQTAGKYYKNGFGFSNGNLFFLAAGIMIISGLLLLIFFKNELKEESSPNKSIKQKISKRKFSSLDSSLKKNYIIFILSLVFILFGMNSITLLHNLYLTNENGFNASDGEIAIKANLWSISSLLAGIFVGSKLGKYQDTSILKWSVVSCIIALSWMAIAPTFGLFLVSVVLLGFVFVTIQASGYSIVARMIPEDFYGRMFAYYNIAFFLSWGLGGTLLTGPIADYLVQNSYSAVRAYQLTFYVAALVVSIGLGLLLYFIKINQGFSITNTTNIDPVTAD